MGNYAEATEELKNAINGNAPFIVIDSVERSRVRALLQQVAAELKTEIDYYTDSHQFTGLLDANRRAGASGAPYEFIEEALKKKGGQAFAVADPKFIENDNPYSRKIIDLAYLAKESGSTLIIATGDNVWSRLSQLGLYIKLDLPDRGEREQQIRAFIERHKKKRAVKLADEEIYNASVLLAGFSYFQLDIMLAQAFVSGSGLTYASLAEMSKKKSMVYGRVPSVTQVFPDKDAEAAGLENLKEWLDKKKLVFYTPDDILKKRDLKPPRGVLLGGVPGCGKSLSAKLIAKAWDLPLYRFDLSSIFDKYVGESEKNMRIALEYIDNVSPCVLWADEIEKMLAVSGDGNDTARRILGQFLFWLQETKARVFLAATANSVDLLPPELFRKGRLSEIFFLGLPSKTERKAAITMYAQRCLHIALTGEQTEQLAALSEGFSFADIENAVKDAAETMLDGEGDALKAVKEKFEGAVSISRAAPETIQKIIAWGRERAVPASRQEV